MTGLSLFSGIGGMDLAFEKAGGRVIGMCEINTFCQKVLRKRWPGIPIFEDIKALRGEDVEAVDVVYGGFPCQPYSVAGKQEGENDSRHLWPQFSRLVGEIRPIWVVAENVPGILQLAGDTVCKDLERQGYSVGIWNYEAAAVGAPHRRMRVFFVAHSRCELRERGTITGTICGEHGGRAPTDAERPSGAPCASDPYTAGNGRGEGTADGRRCGKRSKSRSWDRFADICSTIPDPNRERELQQSGRVEKIGKWIGNSGENMADSEGQRCNCGDDSQNIGAISGKIDTLANAGLPRGNDADSTGSGWNVSSPERPGKHQEPKPEGGGWRTTWRFIRRRP